MRLLHIIGTIEVMGGPTYTVPQLADALARRGHDVELLTVGGGSIEAGSSVTHSAFRKDWRDVPGLKLLWQSAAMKRSLERETRASAIVHSHGLWTMPGLYGAAAARAWKAPYVLSPRGTLNPVALRVSALRKRAFWRLWQGAAVHGAACIHATSEQEYVDCRTVGLRQPIAVIPNGVQVPDLLPRSRTNRRRVLYLGRIHPIKGLVNLVQAWAQLEDQFPEWELRIVGPDEQSHSKQLQGLAAKLGLERVAFSDAKYGEAKQRELAAADIYVLPSFTENFGLSVAEALAQGVAVITTTPTPWSGLVGNGCGWWVPATAEALSKTLREAMTLEPSALQQMGLVGRNWVSRDFAWDSIGGKMEAVYRWLREGGTAPDTVRLD